LKKNKKKDAWSFANKIIVCDARSLYLFHHETVFRKFIIFIVEHKVFDSFIITLILFNSIVLAMQDYSDRENCNAYNKTLNMINNVFSIFFMVECVLKIIAYGFIKHYNAYLSDKWNWLDFSVVLVSIVELTPIPAL